MPGQVSNAEKAFRRTSETIGNVNEIVGGLGLLGGPLELISNGITVATGLINAGFSIADIIRFGSKNPVDIGAKIVETAVRAVPVIGTAIAAGEMAEKVVPAYINANSGYAKGVGSPDMVSWEQAGNKFFFGM